MTWNERMRDSAFAASIAVRNGLVYAGYLPGGSAYHAWSGPDWQRFGTHRKLPIFVATQGGARNAQDDAFTALRGLYNMGVPKGVYTALDMEGVIAPGYVTGYWNALSWAGYKVFVYGQASTVFSNPKCNGYWAAEWAGKGPFMINSPRCRITQYADPATGSGGQWDSSTIQPWTYSFGTWWR